MLIKEMKLPCGANIKVYDDCFAPPEEEQQLINNFVQIAINAQRRMYLEECEKKRK